MIKSDWPLIMSWLNLIGRWWHHCGRRHKEGCVVVQRPRRVEEKRREGLPKTNIRRSGSSRATTTLPRRLWAAWDHNYKLLILFRRLLMASYVSKYSAFFVFVCFCSLVRICVFYHFTEAVYCFDAWSLVLFLSLPFIGSTSAWRFFSLISVFFEYYPEIVWRCWKSLRKLLLDCLLFCKLANNLSDFR